MLTTPARESVSSDVAVKRWTTAPSGRCWGVGGTAKEDRQPGTAGDGLHEPTAAPGERGIGISYVDSTGWVYINVEKPAIFIRAEGDRRGPQLRETHELTRLNGKAAGRLIRTLLTSFPPIGWC